MPGRGPARGFSSFQQCRAHCYVTQPEEMNRRTPNVQPRAPCRQRPARARQAAPRCGLHKVPRVPPGGRSCVIGRSTAERAGRSAATAGPRATPSCCYRGPCVRRDRPTGRSRAAGVDNADGVAVEYGLIGSGQHGRGMVRGAANERRSRTADQARPLWLRLGTRSRGGLLAAVPPARTVESARVPFALSGSKRQLGSIRGQPAVPRARSSSTSPATAGVEASAAACRRLNQER
jgi:hypothetical protein